MVTTSDLLVAGVFFLTLMGGSTYLAAIPLRREVARAVQRGEPMPRIAGWWRGVLQRGAWLLGFAAVLLALGGYGWSQGVQSGVYALLLGLLLAAYVLQAAALVRIIDRTVERTQREAR